MKSLILSLSLMAAAHICPAETLTLPPWIGDHMVLPASREFQLNGTAAPGALITAAISGESRSAKADENGAWAVTLGPLTDGPNADRLIVTSTAGTSTQTRTFEDIALGDTWLCSGQSNMAFPVEQCVEADEAKTAIGTVDVRYFNGSSWAKLTPSTLDKASAVATFFAIDMARKQHQPVGIFVAARGGTGIEGWLPVDAFPNTATGKRMRPLAHDPEVLQAAKEDAADFRPWGQHRLYKWKLGRAVPALLYEELIQPFGDMPISGVLWYQGESNAGSKEYDQWLSNLILAYRTQWGDPRLPFVIIQLPAFDKGTEAGRAAWASLQQMQADVAQRTAYVEMVDIKDLGDLNDIHPRQKKEVGERSAGVMYELMEAQ